MNPSDVAQATAIKAPSPRFEKIKMGDTITSILRNHGFSDNQIGQVLRHDLPFKQFTLVPGEKYRVHNFAPKSQEIKFYLKPSDDVFVLWRDQDRAGAQMKQEEFTIKTRSVSGEVVGSLVASIYDKVPDKWIAYRFMDAYAFDFKLPKGLQRGDKFSLSFEEKYDDGIFISYGEVLSTGLEIKGKMYNRYYVENAEGGGSFIDADSLVSQRPFYAPVSYVRISSHFNPRRKHPIKRHRIPHMGVDFELPAGEAVLSVQDGKVLRTGKNRAAGRFVVVRHSNGVESYYNHLQAVAKNIRPGVYVKSGQVLGEIGCTGYCTKPHLHFAMKKGGRFVDPVKLLKSYSQPMELAISRKVASLSGE